MRFVGLLLLLTHAAVAEDLDELWLRSELVEDAKLRSSYVAQLSSIRVSGDAGVSRIQLETAAQELRTSLGAMLGATIECCDAAEATLTVTVGAADAETGAEGFALTVGDDGVELSAATASGALYGVFDLLSTVRRGEALRSKASAPAMDLRIWDLWDDLTGDVTRGYAGDSLIWPMAMWRDPNRWSGVFDGSRAAPVKNLGTEACVRMSPLETVACGAADDVFWYNTTSLQLSAGPLVPGVVGPARQCLDVDHAQGPNVGTYHCHPLGERDYQNQQFTVRDGAGRRRSERLAGGQCLTLLNAYPPSPAAPKNVSFTARLDAMLRLLKSAGVNGIVLNDVNACYAHNARLLEADILANVTRNLGPAFEKWGLTPYFSACYGSPTVLSNVTCDPAAPEAAAWWARKVDAIYDQMPGFGGFLVKADSEGDLGPMHFGATEADGANLLARALAPHGGVLMWRAFVYANAPLQREELVKQSYETFLPLDGLFDENVVLQIKNGPMDFQIREPLHPLLGAMNRTNVMMEVQAAQEYTGQQIHAVNLVTMWEEYLAFDTFHRGPGSTIADLVSRGSWDAAKPRRSGMACVSNLGSFANWTGHVLAASNTFGFGKLAWDPTRSAESVNAGGRRRRSRRRRRGQRVVEDILARGRDLYEGYTSPLGVGFIVFGGSPSSVTNTSGGCAPVTGGPGTGPKGATCPVSPGLRDLRGGSGTGYAEFYAPEVRAMFEDVDACPVKNLLWFHNVPWTRPMPTPANYTPATADATVPLYDYIRFQHYDAVAQVAELAPRDALEGRVDDARFSGVKARFAQQVHDATVMCDTIMGQFDACCPSRFV
ncbi:alpha-glucuronidase [Aureococcus anophagefferens]|nr:alpha-glucuronidase [Aureococcus anophagefferens]